MEIIINSFLVVLLTPSVPKDYLEEKLNRSQKAEDLSQELLY